MDLNWLVESKVMNVREDLEFSPLGRRTVRVVPIKNTLKTG